nr:hypothetical protein GCM10020063_002990 [Dactylosporangium thailandense]
MQRQAPNTATTADQLSDDVLSMRAMLDPAEDDPIVVWHDLTHVVGVLSRLASLDLPGTGSSAP